MQRLWDSGVMAFYKDPMFFRDSKLSSEEIDNKLGLKIQHTEKLLVDDCKSINREFDSRTWIGLDGQVLNTPYSELFEIVQALAPYDISSAVDLGAGYGRLGVVLSAFFPRVTFEGHELIEQRVNEGNQLFRNLKLDNCCLHQSDIVNSFELKDFDLYFIYDFSDTQDLKIILKKLEEKFLERNFFIIARGRAIRSLIQYHFPVFWAQENAFHQENWSLYKSLL